MSVIHLVGALALVLVTSALLVTLERGIHRASDVHERRQLRWIWRGLALLGYGFSVYLALQSIGVISR